MKNRVKEYDIIRVVSFIFIVIHHTITEVVAKYGFSSWMSNLFLGGIGVSFFIILSGCSLSLSEKNNKFTTYYLSRLSSTLPSYWVAYCMVLIYTYISNHEHHINFDILRVFITIIGMDGYLGSKMATNYLIGEWFTGFILILYVFSQPAIWLVKRNPIITFILASLFSWISVRYSNVIFNNFFLWNDVPLWNPTSRLMEFTFGMLTSIYLLKSSFKINTSAILAVIYLSTSYFLKLSFLQFTLLGSTFCIAAFIILLRAIMLIKVKPKLSPAINFLSKYSFLAFLFHHQIIIQIFNKIKITTITGNSIIYVVMATIFISYVLALIAYKPSVFLRDLVFKKIFLKEKF